MRLAAHRSRHRINRVLTFWVIIGFGLATHAAENLTVRGSDRLVLVMLEDEVLPALDVIDPRMQPNPGARPPDGRFQRLDDALRRAQAEQLAVFALVRRETGQRGARKIRVTRDIAFGPKRGGW